MISFLAADRLWQVLGLPWRNDRGACRPVPYADSATIATEWAHNRAIHLWVMYASDLAQSVVEQLTASLQQVRDDGAKIGLVVAPGETPAPEAAAYADVVVTGPPPPAPFGLFAALERARLSDVRHMGVIGMQPSSILAAHRAGAAAIIGLTLTGTDQSSLIPAQPDAIIRPDELSALDLRRYGRHRLIRPQVLLNPGPAVVSDRVHRAIAGPDLCHREPEYTFLVASVRRKLIAIAGVDDQWAVAFLSGSGTAALEAMTISAVRSGRKILVCRNGVYGIRIETIARRHGIEVIVIEMPDVEPIDPDAVKRALAHDPTIDAVAIVHHETTTGLLNPVHEIAAVAQEHDVLLLCDAISSLGAEDLRLDGTGIDFVACTSNKCLHGLPGVAFVLLSPRAQQRLHEAPRRSLYLDLLAYLDAQARGTVPFTPAIPAMYGLDAALDELLEEGLAQRQAIYARRMAFLDRALSDLGLEPRVASPYRSRSVRSLPLPPGIAYDPLHDALKRQGYVIYAGLGNAAKTSFRVCALGNISLETLEGFAKCLRDTLHELALHGAAKDTAW